MKKKVRIESRCVAVINKLTVGKDYDMVDSLDDELSIMNDKGESVVLHQSDCIIADVIDLHILRKRLWDAGGFSNYYDAVDILNGVLHSFRSVDSLADCVVVQDLDLVNEKLRVLSIDINNVTSDIRTKILKK